MIRKRFDAPAIVFSIAKKGVKISQNSLVTISEGRFVYCRYHGDVWNRSAYLNKMLRFIDVNGFVISGFTLQISQVDLSITSDPNEEMWEFQIPIFV
ncbi:hypothetical protein BK126_04810 [Paenibacillus sp. FSL H7-0326]|nr:hypothetical protein BK126_04810 [Paenibacillus sp. FSL H7-0326]